LFAFGRLDRLGNDHQREVPARILDLFYFGGNAFQRVFNLGYQNDVGPARNAGCQRDMSGVAAHDLQDHDAVMAGRRGLQAVEGLGCHRHRRVEADRTFRHADVVVDRFGNADQVDAALTGQLLQDGKAAVAADSDHGVETQRLEAVDDLA